MSSSNDHEYSTSRSNSPCSRDGGEEQLTLSEIVSGSSGRGSSTGSKGVRAHPLEENGGNHGDELRQRSNNEPTNQH